MYFSTASAFLQDFNDDFRLLKKFYISGNLHTQKFNIIRQLIVGGLNPGAGCASQKGRNNPVGGAVLSKGLFILSKQLHLAVDSLNIPRLTVRRKFQQQAVKLGNAMRHHKRRWSAA